MKNVKVARKDEMPLALPDMVFPSGSKVAIVGPEGSGKTMIIRLIVGIVTPESGEIRYDGEDYVPQKDIAYQPEMPYLIPSSIRENLRRSLDPGMDDVARNALIEETLSNVDMETRLAERADKLSLDEMRCVALARTLMRDRRCLLMDSPFETEHPNYYPMFLEFIKRRVEEMKATFIATYVNPKQAMDLAEIMVVMNGLNVEEFGPADEVFNNPKTKFARGYIESYL